MELLIYPEESIRESLGFVPRQLINLVIALCSERLRRVASFSFNFLHVERETVYKAAAHTLKDHAAIYALTHGTTVLGLFQNIMSFP